MSGLCNLVCRVGDRLDQCGLKDFIVALLEDLRVREEFEEEILSHSRDNTNLSGARRENFAQRADVISEATEDRAHVVGLGNGTGVFEITLDVVPDPVLMGLTVPCELLRFEEADVPGAGLRCGEGRLIDRRLSGFDATYR